MIKGIFPCWGRRAEIRFRNSGVGIPPFSVFLLALGLSLPDRGDDAHAATTQRMTGFRAPARMEPPAAVPAVAAMAEKQQT